MVRLTQDIDIKVLVPDFEYKKARSLIKSAFPNAARQAAPENNLIVAATINDVIVDFLLAIPGYEELIIERAVQRDMGGWKVWIYSAEDLIIQKMVAGQEKDFQDVLSVLIVQQGRLDDEYNEKWLIQFIEALDQPDLLKQYQNLLGKASHIEGN
jgi:predicted nucleotidyltransferase